MSEWSAQAVAARRDAYAAKHGYRASEGRRCLRRMAGLHCLVGIGGRRCDGCAGGAARRAYLDHVAVWVRDGRPACFTAQPYALNSDDLRELVDDAERFDLEITVSVDSWWNPGGTLLIEMRPRGGTP